MSDSFLRCNVGPFAVEAYKVTKGKREPWFCFDLIYLVNPGVEETIFESSTQHACLEHAMDRGLEFLRSQLERGLGALQEREDEPPQKEGER